MGFGDWVSSTVDSIGDGLEDAWDQGKEWVGDGVEGLSHLAEDGLDHVGLHSAADWVREHGDDLADQLGADVGEMSLGETDDPKQLVHGDTGKIQDAVDHLTALSGSFGQVASGMKGIETGDWRGTGGGAFDVTWEKTPKDWTTAQKACSDVAGALSTYSSTLTWAQGQAKEAIRQWKDAEKKQQEALDAHNDAVDTYNAAVKAYNGKIDAGKDPGEPPTKPGEFHDPGPALFKAAQDVLDEARKQRNDAAETAVSTIQKATDSAPPIPAFHNRMGADLHDLYQWKEYQETHFVGGVLKGTGDLVRFARTLNPTDPYNLTHPAEYLSGMSDTAAGLVYASHHPGALVHGLVGSGWTTDPAEALGKLVPQVLLAVGTDGAGTAADAGAGVAERAVVGLGERETGGIGERAAGLGDDLAGTAEKGRLDDVKVCERDPVDVATGAVVLEQRDLELPGVLPLVVRRKHSSDWTFGLWFGRSWASTFDERVDLDEHHVVVVRADATASVYPHPTVDEPVAPVAGGAPRLARTEVGGFQLTDPETGEIRHYLRPVDGRSPLAAVTDRTGHRVTIVRDPYGAPVELRHTGGYRVLVDTAEQRVTGLTVINDDGSEPVTTSRYEYDDGRLARVVNASGQPLRFAYDDAGRLAEWTDRNGTVFTYSYDAEGRCVGQVGPSGVLASGFGYTAVGDGLRETVVTDSAGHATTYLVDDRFQVVAVTDPLGARTRSVRDDRDRLLSRTDPLGRTTSYDYDADGNLVGITRPDGARQTVAWTTAGGRPCPVRATLPDGTVWTFEYDERGNRTAVTDPAGATTRFGYDDRGHLVSVTDAAGRTRTIDNDGAGLPLVVTEADGSTTRLERDAFGRVVALTDALGGRVELTWTPEGQLASRTLPDGSTATWIYDGEGNPVEHVDAAGRTTRTTYTHFDLPAEVTAPDGSVTRYTWDAELRLTAVTNPQGRVWRYAYDAAGRLASETDFNGRTLRYEHDAAGQLVRRTNGASETVDYELDALGRVQQQRAGDAVTTLTHDPLGRLLRATGPDVELVLQRDPLGRVVAESLNGRTVSSAYDVLGRRVRRTTPAGVEAVWSYGLSGLPERLTVAGHEVAFHRDLLGRETRRELGGAVLDQGWDPLGQLVSQTLAVPAAAPEAALRGRLEGRLGASGGGAGGVPEPVVLQQRRYTYAAGGRLVGVDDRLSGARRLELDLADRITSVSGPDWSEVYSYDPLGNITSATAGDDAERREYAGTLLTRSGRNRYSYDAQGRLVSRVRSRLSRKAETWAYEWDAEDRLVGCRTPDGTRWRYVYDVLGRRVAKRRLDHAGAVVEEVLFAWDDSTLVEESAASGVRSWVHDGLAPLAQVELAQELPQEEVDARFLAIVTDLVGAPTELVSADGELVWHARRTVWGAPADPSADPTPLRFPGQYADPETGLFYNLNRYYDPATGRYVSQDPLGLAPAPNPTAYVHNPTTWADPLGLSPCDPVNGPSSAEGPRALESGRKLEAHWQGTTNYNHGGEMTAIEHINYRHAYGSGFTNVSHFAEGTSARDIYSMVDQALRRGEVTPNGDSYKVVYDTGRTIGTDKWGAPTSRLQIYVLDGRIRTAFPVG
ncbi:putative T7SS-secreted protein [Nocardioides cheoyonin]|uniref:putative T7SS-secreted protein n=1 Tax=Nocardioides cheoyonin TaxID=3156615 RepID=UPI0032B3BAF6